MNQLPDFPTDDSTLDLIISACRPEGLGIGGLLRSSIEDLARMYSELGGSDLTAVEHDTAITMDGHTFPVQYMRDQQYHHNDIILALAKEVKRLRSLYSVHN